MMPRAPLLLLLPLLTAADARPPLLRIRGGASAPAPPSPPPPPPALILAARRLCSAPGLLSAAGTSRGFRLSDHVRGVVFGGMDGILTTFALLAALGGSGSTSSSLTLVVGISTVLADALSMAAGEYLSAKAEIELLAGRARPADEPHPLEKGLAMFVAFTLFGSVPLLGFVLTAFFAVGSTHSFQISIAITAATLFVLGAVKTTFGVGVWWKSGLEVTGIGGVAAFVAFFTAQTVDYLTSGRAS